MFQSDDYDSLLAEENFQTTEFTDVTPKLSTSSKTLALENNTEALLAKLNSNRNEFIDFPTQSVSSCLAEIPERNIPNQPVTGCLTTHTLVASPETPFRNKRKRKFPGPAGLLPDDITGREAEKLGNTIQLSQNYSCSQQWTSTIFQEAPWLVMKNDTRALSLCTITSVKSQALAHRLTGRKVPLLAGVVISVDRSLQDPLVLLRDNTAEIQCTLHRDAWECLGCHLVPQYSVILLKNTTVLTTGTALKKIYLNITNRNIVSVYCDEENSVTLNSNITKLSDVNLPKIYSTETISYQNNKVIILRNVLIKEQQKNSGQVVHSESTLIPHNPSDDILAQTLLEGITDEMLEDFE